MKCIIIEDQAPAQRILKKFIGDVETLELLDTFSDVTRALDFLANHEVDLIFLDIHLPKMTGMEFLKIKPGKSYVILTTAYADYALESYEHNVVDYLLKPFSFQRFVQAVAKVQQLLLPKTTAPAISRSDVTEIFIKSGYDHIKLVIAEIRYIMSDGDYTEIYTPDKKHLSAEPLRFWINFLNPAQFVQIHKSYLINMHKVERISGNRVFLDSGEDLPIGRVFKDAFAEKFLRK